MYSFGVSYAGIPIIVSRHGGEWVSMYNNGSRANFGAKIDVDSSN